MREVTMAVTTQSAKHRFHFPNAFTILFGLIIVVAALTWIIPAGQYETAYSDALDRDVPVAGTYTTVAAHPHSPLDAIMAPIPALSHPAGYEANPPPAPQSLL